MIHVIEISLPDSSANDELPVEQKMSNLLTLVHRAAKGRSFAIGLPGYKDGDHRSLGQCLQLFSFDGAETIRDIVSNRRLSLFVMDWCATSPIRAVPNSGVETWAIYRKSQLAKKHSPSHQRRALARAEKGIRKQADHVVDSGIVQTKIDRLPRFFHYSQSSDSPVTLFIERASGVASGTPIFDSFGLALSGSCGVPVLNKASNDS